MWTRCSPIELAELARVHEDSNPDPVIRNHMSYPLDDGRLAVTARFERAASRVSVERSYLLSHATIGGLYGS